MNTTVYVRFDQWNELYLLICEWFYKTTHAYRLLDNNSVGKPARLVVILSLLSF